MFVRWLALSVSLGLVLPAQEKPTAPPPADVLARLPANTSNLLVLRDVMPHVDALLGSPLLRDVLLASGAIQEELFGMQFDPAAVRRQLGLVRDLIPSEVVLAAPEATAGTLLQAFEVAIGYALLLQLDREGEGAADGVAALRERAGAALAAVGDLQALGWVQLRDERTAERWFDDVAALAGQALGEASVVTVEGAVLTVRVQPLSMFGGALRDGLVARGVVVPPGAGPEFVARLTQAGSQIELRLGTPAEGPLPAARLGRLWRADARQLLFTKLDVGDASEHLLELCEHATELADTVRQPELSLRLHGLAEQVSWLSTPTVSSIEVGDGIVRTVETDFGPEAAGELDAPAAAVVRCVAREDGVFVLSALPLDVFLSSAFDDAAVQLARRGAALPAELDGAVEFLAGEQSMLFGPGSLLICRPAQFRGAAKPALGPMPFAAVALVAKVIDEGGAADFVAQMTEQLQDGYGAAGQLWQAGDLGLGVPTQVLDLTRILPGYATAGVDADFAPHWCVVDGVMVLSSDAKLTTDLLARIRGTAAPELPARRLVDWSSWPGVHWADTCAGIAKWWGTVPEAERPQERVFRRLDVVLNSLASLCRMVDSLETIRELDGATFREVTRLRLHTPK